MLFSIFDLVEKSPKDLGMPRIPVPLSNVQEPVGHVMDGSVSAKDRRQVNSSCRQRIR